MRKTIFTLFITLTILLSSCTTETPQTIQEKPDDNKITDPVEENTIEEPEQEEEKPKEEIIEEKGELTKHTFDFEGTTREYDLFTPANYDESTPLIFVLHGYTSTKTSIRLYTGFNKIAEEEGFAVVYPQGLKYNSTTHWNAELEGTQVNDIGFLTSLAKYLQDEYSFQSNRTFMTGHSNGGFMSYTVACHNDGTFNGFASYAGLMSNTTWNTCTPSTQTSILHIHGTSDNVVPNDGSMSMLGGFGGAPDILTMLEFWTDYNNLQNENITNINDNVKVYEYTGNDFYRIKYVELNNHSHNWSPYEKFLKDEDTLNDISQLIWEFFNQIIKNEESK